VGILSRHFTPHTETFATIPLFEYLDRDQFEVILYTLQVTQEPLEQYCLSRVDKWIHLPPQLIDQVQTIRSFLDSHSYGAKIGKLLQKLVKESQKK